jgi:hypothetical protein
VWRLGIERDPLHCPAELSSAMHEIHVELQVTLSRTTANDSVEGTSLYVVVSL